MESTQPSDDYYLIKKKYTNQAYTKAGIIESKWQPELGYVANKAIMYQVYNYYQTLYFKNPTKFYWLGLARLTGGQVLWGMNRLCKIAKDPCAITQHIVAIAKDIFETLAWQHELFLENPELLIALLKSQTLNNKNNYSNIWEHLSVAESATHVSLYNLQILENEQYNTVQPHYDAIRKDAYSRKYLFLTRFTMRNIHPYHHRFIIEKPLGDVTIFTDRWHWISHPKGMWQRWSSIKQDERNRLVALDNHAVIHHNW